MMNNYVESEAIITDSVRVKIGFVQLLNKDWIRLRIFKKWSSDQLFHPSKSGIMIDVESFKQKVMPILAEMMKD